MPQRNRKPGEVNRSRKPSAAQQPARYCDYCRSRLKPGGRPSASGKHFCSGKKACIAARARDQYARAEKNERLDAPTTCTACHASLVPRKMRFGDIPELGRFCSRRPCQGVRKKMIAQYESRKNDNINLVVKFVAASHDPEKVITCPVCGLEDVVVDFMHPIIRDGAMAICNGVGYNGVKKEIAELRWPKIFAAVSS